MASNAEVAVLHDHQSGARIGSNDDLVTEILIRLPVTSILRFKSASKHWRSLLTHKHFTRRYDNKNFPKSLGLLFCCDHYPYHNAPESMYVPFDVENRIPPPLCLRSYLNSSVVKIEQSCNGLLLCSALHNGAREYYVFNPTTKQLAIVPSLPDHIRAMALAYHQTDCVHYKVVCIRDLDLERNLCQIQVYSSDTRKWKICIESFSACKPFIHHPVYWNGAVYLPSYDLNINIWYFNLDVEQLQMLPLPVEMMSYDETSTMYFGESGGHLHLIFHMDREEDTLMVSVYEMLTDHSGWFVKYRIQLYGLLHDFPCLVTTGHFRDMEHPYQNDFEVVDVVRGEEEEGEDTFLMLLTSAKVIRYNIHDKSFKELYSSNNYVELSCFHRYIETLSSF